MACHMFLNLPSLLLCKATMVVMMIMMVLSADPVKCRRIRSVASGIGRWEMLQRNIGISAMHMALLHNDRVIIFDRTDFGPSNLSLPSGQCRNDDRDLAMTVDCTAHSVEYTVSENVVRPLMVLTDTWCSSGAFTPDGNLIQTGGFNDGERAVREFRPCDDVRCDWEETGHELSVRRWYASDQSLPDGRVIVIGGRRQFNYEFIPSSGNYTLPFLRQTHSVSEDNLYPFLHLLPDGNLFIFANNQSILLDYRRNVVVRKYPPMPDGQPRNYPSSGSSVMLPIDLTANSIQVEVLVCGGAPAGSYAQAVNGNYVPALATCGRIKVTDASPVWSMESMPMRRVMGDMVLLPTGDVLIINGVSYGTAGWELGRIPVLTPLIYQPSRPEGLRFQPQATATIPRVYHSTAMLLRDGRVLVGGSNPHMNYSFGADVTYPTELSLEAFSPAYMFASSRPTIQMLESEKLLTYGDTFKVRFSAGGVVDDKDLSVRMVAPTFTTHSYGMNQRMLVLKRGGVMVVGGVHELEVTAPPVPEMAPPGYYMLFVVNGEVPSEGVWVNINV